MERLVLDADSLSAKITEELQLLHEFHMLFFGRGFGFVIRHIGIQLAESGVAFEGQKLWKIKFYFHKYFISSLNLLCNRFHH